MEHSEVTVMVHEGRNEDEDKMTHLKIVVIGPTSSGKTETSASIIRLQLKPTEYVSLELLKKSLAHAVFPFQRKTRRFTISDEPFCRGYYDLDLIRACSLADIGLLVISALPDEFEAGYQQTCEHLILAKALGVSRFVVLINKMDALGWPEERYAEIKLQMSSFLVSTLHNVMEDVVFVPISGRLALNLETPVVKECPWWDGPCLLDVLDTVKVPPRDPRGPLRISIIDVYTPDETPEGTPFVEVTGKVLSGSIREGDELVVLPSQVDARVEYIFFLGDEHNTRCAGPGATIHVGLRGVVEAQISPGFVLCDIVSPVHAATEFNVELELLEGRPHIVHMQQYFNGVLCIHSIEVECHVWLSYQLDHPLRDSRVCHMCSIDRLCDWDLMEHNISYRWRPFFERTREDGVKFRGVIQVDNAMCLDFEQGPHRFVLIRNGIFAAKGTILGVAG